MDVGVPQPTFPSGALNFQTLPSRSEPPRAFREENRTCSGGGFKCGLVALLFRILEDPRPPDRISQCFVVRHLTDYETFD